MTGAAKTSWMAGAGLALCAALAWGQTREVSVAYLRAALGAISDRGRVAVQAEYLAAEGLTEATGTYLRNKGFSRFTIKDPETGLTFESLYCAQDSKPFQSLLEAKPRHLYLFEGYKGTGEGRMDALFVTAVTDLGPIPQRTAPKEVIVDRPRAYRVTVIDRATSNRTVLVNVELGKEYSVLGSTLRIEEESETAPPAAP